jgi:hypothetical protein
LSVAVPPGSHEVAILKPGYVPKRIRLKFENGKTTALRGGEALLAVIPAPPEPPKLAPPPIATPVRVPAEPPSPKPAPPDPRQVEAAEWARVQDSRDIPALEDFRRRYPAGANSEHAARRIEQLGWESVNRTDMGALRAYVQRFPNSSDIPQAQAEIARLEQARRAAADAQAIARALKSYEAAFARRELNDLRAIWPTMPKNIADTYRSAFRAVQSITVQMQPTGEPAVSGSTATVICRRSIHQVADRKPYDKTDRVRVVLSRDGDGWVIQSIEESK